MSDASGNIAIVLLFWGLNQLLSIFNSWALKRGIAFPCFMSLSTSLLYAVIVVVAAGCGSTRFRRAIASASTSSAATDRRVRAVAFWSTLNVILNNISLVYLPLSVNQVLRSTIPVITVLVSVVHGRAPSASEASALALLVGGVVIVIGKKSYGVSFDGHQVLTGVFFCMCGTVAAANGLHATSQALHGGGGSVDALDLGWRIVPWNVVLVLPIFLVSELRPLVAYVSADPSRLYSVLFVTATSSILASSYNIVHMTVTSRTGPVMTTVLGQLKIVCLVVVSRLFLEDDGVSGTEVVGFAVALFGFSWYTLQSNRTNVKRR